MRRRLACTTVLLLVSPVLIGTTASTAGASPSSSANAAPTRIRAGSVWTLEAGTHCQADSFASHHGFSDAISDGTGDHGHDQGSKSFKMTWTAGTDGGAVFRGKFSRKTGRYAGTYASAKSAAKVPATLAPATAVGCPDLTGAPVSSPLTFGGSDSDTATVTGADGVTPTGNVTFWICPGDDSPCTPGSSASVSLGAVALSGAGSTATADSTAYTPPAAGSYCFGAAYAGDQIYGPTTDDSMDSQCFTVIPGAVLTTAPASTAIVPGSSDSDTATVTGEEGAIPTGTVDFSVCLANSGPCPADSAGLTDLGAVSLAGSGDSATATSASFTPTAAGRYCFLADYSGDDTYPPAADNSDDNECFTVTSPSVGLGSPENSLGTGDLNLGVGSPTGIWAAVNGFCTAKENGDEFLSGWDASWNGSTWACPSNGTSTPTTVPNYEYNGGDGATAGYSYEIVTPGDPGQRLTEPLTLEAYDPAYEPTPCNGATTPDESLGGQSTSITTTYSLTEEPVADDPNGDIPVAGLSVGPTSGPTGQANQYVAVSGDQNTCGQWATLFTIPVGSPDGDYRLQVTTPQSPGQNSDGSNAYGLRVYQGPTFTRCSTIITVAWYSASCPVIQGENALSVFANESGGSGNFYLAQVPATDAGGIMEVSLFDPGEGDHDIQVVQPNGTPATFQWQTTDDCPGYGYGPPSATAPDCAQDLGFQHLQSTGTIGATDSLNVSGTITPPEGVESASEFNNRRVMLAFTIPPDYDAPNGGWWQIHYDAGAGAVSDRTTWSVSVSAPSAEPSVLSVARASALRRDSSHLVATPQAAPTGGQAHRSSSSRAGRRVDRRQRFRGVL